VLTALVALTHAVAVIDWYYAFSPTPKLEGLLSANVAFGQVLGFPFEVFGIFALLALAVLASTSHDFWLSYLSPPVWKRLHLLIYPAYAAAVAHVALGYLQDVDNPAFGLLFGGAALAVAGLHFEAWRRGAPAPAGANPWVEVGRWDAIPDGRAIVVRLGGDEAAAVFRNGATLSAVSNACAHQNGPLGEGRILDGCITCPWHGFQYRPEDGCAPAPYTERLPTYRLRLEGPLVLIDRNANPPGTPIPPLPPPPGAWGATATPSLWAGPRHRALCPGPCWAWRVALSRSSVPSPIWLRRRRTIPATALSALTGVHRP
jgi:nitrite reductase/ring-hydroxylating ferredoxin subunit